MATPVLLGIDIGTSDTKVLVTSVDGDELAQATTGTRWTSGRYTETDPDALFEAVLAVTGRALDQAEQRCGAVRATAVGVTGFGESGVLLDPSRRPRFPIMAWFDPRGGAELPALAAELVTAFPGRTGLPVSALPTTAKLAWMRTQGVDLNGHVWLSGPEYIAHRLGCEPTAEFSLAARTGLLDQDTAAAWPEMLDALGADDGLLPPLAAAGTPLGRVTGDVPEALRGAVITVAGHDHPVAAVGSGAVERDCVFDSFGTAQVLVRAVADTTDATTRELLTTLGIETVQHVLPGRQVLIAGTRSGLLLRRTLDLLGAHEPAARDRLDRAAVDLLTHRPPHAAGVRVTGAGNDDGALRITVDADGTTPAALWVAALDHGIGAIVDLLAVMGAQVGPSTRTVVAGGWTRMASVRMAKQAALPGVTFSQRQQAGAYGATLFARQAGVRAEGGPPNDPTTETTPEPGASARRPPSGRAAATRTPEESTA
ncbi:carbohydrate kinase [Nakamurella flavida]|uniref:Carbohydrate kinase n=1 Tax=Nakamurella flavida TaxID=363630 RepID=A0A938YHW3_9ACTN|nr:FGGY family carbohydrate kinase [Nakamurella flavida]MBM9475404.1 carbohydrate kinase [Nakamurella flavida]MBM9475508.1 carbohydrate kinase [Nakamurella flavida]MDP9776984.1 sugar (pentulose or hexulose) kinase [Nakamurella flavida]